MPERRKSKYLSRRVSHPEPPHRKLGKDGKVKIYDDGSIKATKFIDDNDRDISFAEFNKKIDNVEGYYFERPIDDATVVQYIPDKTTKVFKTKVSQSVKIKNVFAVIAGSVKRFVLENLDRYKHEDRFLKREIDKVIKRAQNYHFALQGQGENYYNRRYIDSTNFGPYNYDVKLKVTESVFNINDILVIKTGNFAEHKVGHGLIPSGETIIFATPTTVKVYTGSGEYLSTGTHWTSITETGYNGVTGYMYTGTYSNTYTQKFGGMSNSVDIYSVSSSHVYIPKGTTLETKLYYTHTADGHPDSEPFTFGTRNQDPLDGQIFSWDCGTVRTKGKRKHEVYTGIWDGVIPSGVPFKFETWSTNPTNIGFNGEISVTPIDETITCDFETTCTAEGIDEIYETSILKAKKKAEGLCYRKLNNYLVDKGVKSKNAKMKKFESMITKNAQNIYEGLSYIRNESLQKQRGIVFSPLDSLYYYDGTLETYGGSKLNAKYSYKDIIDALENNTKASLISPYSSQGGSSTATNTSNMGY